MRRIRLKSIARNILNLLIVVVAIVAFFYITRFIAGSWSTTHKEWLGAYYTQNGDKTVSSKEFDNYKDCAAWGKSQLAKAKPSADAYYACGRDCEFKTDTITSGKRVNTYVCKEFIKSTDK